MILVPNNATFSASHVVSRPQALVRSKGGFGYEAAAGQGWGSRERELAGALEEGRRAVHEALCDNVDTVTSVKALLVRFCDRRCAHPAPTLRTRLS